MRAGKVLLLAAGIFYLNVSFAAPVVWTGGPAAFGNPDALTGSANVALARNLTQPLYNSVLESSYTALSPLDTEWAFSLINGNPVIAFLDAGSVYSGIGFSALTFADFTTALGGPGPAGGGSGGIATTILNRPGILHLITEDIYIDIEFTTWGIGPTTSIFAYNRTTNASSVGVVPVPAALPLLLSGIAGIGFAARRLRDRSR